MFKSIPVFLLVIIPLLPLIISCQSKNPNGKKVIDKDIEIQARPNSSPIPHPTSSNENYGVNSLKQYSYPVLTFNNKKKYGGALSCFFIKYNNLPYMISARHLLFEKDLATPKNIVAVVVLTTLNDENLMMIKTPQNESYLKPIIKNDR